MTATEATAFNAPEPVAALGRSDEAAGDSISVAVWTAVSRATGVARVVAIGAVLGPTFLGNVYQFTNSLPNIIYYGFLAGSLVSSLLVPALVRHVDGRDRAGVERVAGGFLGTAMLGLLIIAPLAVVLAPSLLRVASLGALDPGVGGDQERVARLLVLMVMPQAFCYAVVAPCTAVMNSHRRFALAAAAPALENLGIIVVLGVTAIVYGTGASVGDLPIGELLLLGLGSTAAVALHASVQWWGAHRVGASLRPRAGWRDAEVRVVLRRSLPSLMQAGLVGFQLLAMLTVVNRVSGGVVAYQVALNFFFLPVALCATPIALSLQPRLSRLHLLKENALLRKTFEDGYAFVLFLTVPAAVGYVVLAPPLAHVIAVGRMDTPWGVTLVSASLAAVAFGIVGQSAFLVATFASYARGDTWSPLRSTVLQAVVGLALTAPALMLHGARVVVVVGTAYSTASVVAAVHLTARLRRRGTAGAGRLSAALLRALAAAAAMAVPVWSVSELLAPPGAGRAAAALAVLAGVLVGAVTFLGLQRILRSPELAWITAGVHDVAGRVVPRKR